MEPQKRGIFFSEVDASEVVEYFLQSQRELRKHAMPEGEIVEPIWDLYLYYQSVADLKKAGVASESSAGRAAFEAVWVNAGRYSGELLWDRVICNNLTRAEYERIAEGLLDNPLDFDQAAEAKDWPDIPTLPVPGPLWKYHPERMGRYTPYGKGLAKIGVKHKGQCTLELMNELMSHYTACDKSMLEARPLRRRAFVDRDYGRAFRHFEEALLGYAVFCGHGRQLFEIPHKLVDMFSKSDVDDIQWGHVRMPYASIYLHFGPQPDMDLGGGWLIEGAYLTEMTHDDNRHVNITVVSAPPSTEAFCSPDTISQPGYTAALGPQHMNMALAEALDSILAEKINLLRDQSEREPMAAELEKMAQAQGLPPGVKVVSIQRKRSGEELGLLSDRHDMFKRALRLVVNALCYLTAYTDDVDTVWPNNTPQSLLRELKNAGKNRNERTKALDKLAQQGFTAVNICGRTLLKEQAQHRETHSSSGERIVATHWARGHWKRQPHGPQNSLRKLQWRMPMLRRSRIAEETEDEGDDEVLGHVYTVS